MTHFLHICIFKKKLFRHELCESILICLHNLNCSNFEQFKNVLMSSMIVLCLFFDSSSIVLR